MEKPNSNNLFVFQWVSNLGGADTRIVDCIKLWSTFMNVTVVPNYTHQLKEKQWTSYFDSLNVKYCKFEDLPERIEGFGISMSNCKILKDVDKIKSIKDKGIYYIFSSEMMYPFSEELPLIESGIIQCVLYNSEINKARLQPTYLSHNPKIEQFLIENYINPENFLKKEKESGLLTIGRHSRAHSEKYPNNFIDFMENLDKESEYKIRIMGWDETLEKKYNKFKREKEWEFLNPNQEKTSDFLNTLDIFPYVTHVNFTESWGRSPFEALLTGVPILVPTGHYFEKYVENGKNGFICSNYLEFQQGFRHLLNKENRLEMSENASTMSRKHEATNADFHISKWKELFNYA